MVGTIGSYAPGKRLRRYQLYYRNVPGEGLPRYCGFLEGWDLTARDALEITAGETTDGVRRMLRGNRCLCGDGGELSAEKV